MKTFAEWLSVKEGMGTTLGNSMQWQQDAARQQAGNPKPQAQPAMQDPEKQLWDAYAKDKWNIGPNTKAVYQQLQQSPNWQQLKPVIQAAVRKMQSKGQPAQPQQQGQPAPGKMAATPVAGQVAPAQQNPNAMSDEQYQKVRQQELAAQRAAAAQARPEQPGAARRRAVLGQ